MAPSVNASNAPVRIFPLCKMSWNLCPCRKIEEITNRKAKAPPAVRRYHPKAMHAPAASRIVPIAYAAIRPPGVQGGMGGKPDLNCPKMKYSMPKPTIAMPKRRRPNFLVPRIRTPRLPSKTKGNGAYDLLDARSQYLGAYRACVPPSIAIRLATAKPAAVLYNECLLA